MHYDVIIAGGGPVGLLLAGELRLGGVSVLVLEKLDDTRTPLKASPMGMRGLTLPSVEAFYRRGLLEAVRESAIGWTDAGAKPGIDLSAANASSGTRPPRFAGHFAGIVLDANKIDFSSEKFMLSGPSASGGLVSQEGIEALLAKRAGELGAELRRGTAVTGFVQDDRGVAVQAGEKTIRARWLVGCDGGRSTVRKCAGIDFVGTDPELTGRIALVDIADPEKLRPGWNLTSTGLYVNGPLPGRIGVVEFDGAAGDRNSPVTLEEVQDSLRRVSGTDVTLTALHVATRYTDNARQATTYRKNRVLLAGDAAHVHSPFGGQGLNLGIGDAMNLGWKLAATVNGWAPEGLLDSYTDERHPIGAWAVEWTRAQVAIMRPEPHARAMAAIVRDLIETPAGATFFARQIAGTWLRYDLRGDHQIHPLIGRSAPDFEFEDGTRLGALLHGGKAALIDLDGTERLRDPGKPWSGRVSYACVKARDSLGLTALLVRPDGFVAWVSEDAPDLARCAQIMRHWFGGA